jgi:hypothetical protein
VENKINKDKNPRFLKFILEKRKQTSKLLLCSYEKTHSVKIEEKNLNRTKTVVAREREREGMAILLVRSPSESEVSTWGNGILREVQISFFYFVLFIQCL